MNVANGDWHTLPITCTCLPPTAALARSTASARLPTMMKSRPGGGSAGRRVTAKNEMPQGFLPPQYPAASQVAPPQPQVETGFSARHHCSFWAAVTGARYHQGSDQGLARGSCRRHRGTIAQMHASVAARPFSGTRCTRDPAIACHRGDGAGQPLHARRTRSGDRRGPATPAPTITSVLHIPDPGLVAAGDVIYNGVHRYLGESVAVGGFGPWRDAIGKVEAFKPRRIIAGHQTNQLDDDAEDIGRTAATSKTSPGPVVR
jgi:hypothetical protein